MEKTNLRFSLLLSLFMLFTISLNADSKGIDFVSVSPSVEVPAWDVLTDADSKAMDIIKSMEGFRSESYFCPGGRRTIGYGFTGRKETFLSKEECDIILIELYKEVKLQVLNSTKGVDLNAQQVASLTSFVYNIGITRFRTSTMYKRIKLGELSSVGTEFGKWKKARVNGVPTILRGLVKRRVLERDLWLSDIG